MSVSYRVYKNLFELAVYRNLEIISGDLTEISQKKLSPGESLDENDLINSIQREGYIMLEAKDTPEKKRKLIKGMNLYTENIPTKTIFALLSRRSEFTTAAAKFDKLLVKIPDIKSGSADFNLDIIIITYEDQKSNITNKFAKYAHAGSNNEGYVRLILHTYKMFTSNKMKSLNVSPGRILSEVETKNTLKELKIKKVDLPKKRVIDVLCVWLGAEIGDVIEEDVDSEVTGVEVRYSYVRP